MEKDDRPQPLTPGDFIWDDSDEEVKLIEVCTGCRCLIKVRLEEAQDPELICLACAKKKRRK